MPENFRSRFIATIRAAAIRTRNRPVFLGLYRAIYRGALGLFSAAFRLDFKGRGALYLRRGMAGREWLPGISDIDLLAAVDDDGPEAVLKLWRLYLSFKRIFPFFGELQIAEPRELDGYAQAGGWRAHEMPEWKIASGRPAKIKESAAAKSGLGLFHLQESLAAYLSLAQTYFGAAEKKEPPEFGFKASKFFIDVFRHGQAAMERARNIPTRREYLAVIGSHVSAKTAKTLERPEKIGRSEAFELLLAAMIFADETCVRHFSDSVGRRLPLQSPNAGEWYDLVGSPDPNFALWSRRARTLAVLDIPGGCGLFMDNLFRWFIVLDRPPSPQKFKILAARMDRWHLRENAFSAPGWAFTYNILQGLLYSPFLDSPFLAHGLGPPGTPGRIWLLKHSRRYPLWNQYYRLQWNVDARRLFAPDRAEMATLARQTAAALKLSARALALDPETGHNAYRIFFLLSRVLGPRLYLEDGSPLDAQDADDLLQRYRARFPDSEPWIRRLESEWLSRPEAEANAEAPEAFFRAYWPFLKKETRASS